MSPGALHRCRLRRCGKRGGKVWRTESGFPVALRLAFCAIPSILAVAQRGYPSRSGPRAKRADAYGESCRRYPSVPSRSRRCPRRHRRWYGRRRVMARRRSGQAGKGDRNNLSHGDGPFLSQRLALWSQRSAHVSVATAHRFPPLPPMTSAVGRAFPGRIGAREMLVFCLAVHLHPMGDHACTDAALDRAVSALTDPPGRGANGDHHQSGGDQNHD